MIARSLATWSEPESFLGDLTDDDHLWSGSLSCLSQCLRDVLRGHGVRSTLPHLVRPLGLVFSVDRTFRPWLLGQAEEEFDEPAYERGLGARWRWATDPRRFAALLDETLAGGRVAIVRANRWRVPGFSRADLTPPEWHTSVITERSERGLRILDRQPVAGRIETRCQVVAPGDLDATAAAGAAVLDYELGPAPADLGLELHSLLARSIELARPRLVRPSGKEYGPAALDALRTAFSTPAASALDSRHLRLMMRWHLPECIRKYVVGNRTVLRLRLSMPDSAFAGGPVTAALEASERAWELLARSFALAARAAGPGPEPGLIESMDAVEASERELLSSAAAAVEAG